MQIAVNYIVVSHAPYIVVSRAKTYNKYNKYNKLQICNARARI